MDKVPYEIRWYVLPLIISFVVLLLNKTVNIAFVSAITLFLKQALEGSTTIQVLQFCYFAAMLGVSLKLSFGSIKKVLGESNNYTMPSYIITFVSPFVLGMAIISGFMLAEAVVLINDNKRDGFYFAAWAFYLMLTTFSFLMIVDNALKTYHLAITTWFRNRKMLVRSIGYLMLMLTSVGIGLQIYDNYFSHA